MDVFATDTFDDNVLFNKDMDMSRRSRLDSRMSVCLPSKGLFNAPGENNCFLNAGVQMLWHLNVFRRSFRLLEGHACLEDACIFCALKDVFIQLVLLNIHNKMKMNLDEVIDMLANKYIPEKIENRIFQQFQDSDATVLAPDGLRQAMANAFSDDQRFQLGKMDDAAECFENILNRLHSHTANEPEDSCSAKHCIPHQKFALHILEQTFCQCQASGEPKSFYQFVYYIAASVIVDQMNSDDRITFGEVLKSTLSAESRPCPDEKRCYYKNSPESRTSIQTTLLNCPDVVTVGIIWDTDSPSSKYITDVLDCIGQRLFLIDLFDNIPDDDYRRLELKLSGMVTYYGRHYTSFFYDTREEQWVYFDDAHVKKIGSQWQHVVSKCRRNRFQPLLVVYTNSSGLPIDPSTAPSSVEIVSKEKLLYRPQKLPIHRKHHKAHTTHRKHKKNRSRNTSPSELNPTNGLERSSSRSSANSSSPNSLRKHGHKHGIYRDQLQRELQHHHEIVKDNFVFQNQAPYISSANSSVSLRGSRSDGSIVDSTSNDQTHYIPRSGDFLDNSFDQTDHGRKKRPAGDFIKKKFSNAMKTINPLKKPNAKSYTTKVHSGYDYDSTADSPKNISYADIGFHSPTQKSKSSQSSENSFTTQLQNLERHQTMLNHSQDNLTDIENIVPEFEDTREKFNDDVYAEDDDSFVTNGVNSWNSDDTFRENLIHFDSRPQVVTISQPPSYEGHLEVEFEKLLHKGEHLTNLSLQYEKRGDIFRALHECALATAVYRKASKLPGMNDDLVQFVDHKRSQSYARSKELQEKANLLISCDVISPASERSTKSPSCSPDECSYDDTSVNSPNCLHLYETPAERISEYTSSYEQSSENLIRFSPEKTVESHHEKIRSTSSRFNSLPQTLQLDPAAHSQVLNQRELADLNSILDNLDKDGALTNKPTSSLGNSTSFPRTAIQWTLEKPNGGTLSNTQDFNQFKNVASHNRPHNQPTTVMNEQNERQLKAPGQDLRESIQRNPRLYNSSSHTKTLPNKLRTSLPNKKPTNSSSKLQTRKLNQERIKSIYDNVENDFATDLNRSVRNKPKTIYDDNLSIPRHSLESQLDSNSRTQNLITGLNNRHTDDSSPVMQISDTLQKLKIRGKKSRCAQCGWRTVEVEGGCCENCQSEYL